MEKHDTVTRKEASRPAAKARLSIRIPEEQKDLIERAASYCGLNTTDFTIATLVDRARDVVREHELTSLSDRDRDAFLALLDSPPAPNEALRRAAGRYRDLVFASGD